jgi:glycosyltransferase involved in cell wall biosynthesis
VVRSRWPNKILNVGLKFGLINLERLAGKFDLLFMPNLNQYSILPGAKLAITVHDLSPILTPEFYDIKRQLWHKFLNYKKAFARANVLFTVSEHTKKDLIRVFNVPENKIKVVYPGIDHGAFNPHISPEKQKQVRNRYELPGDFYLFLSTIEPRKNLSTVIKAFENLNNNAWLVIAGRPGWKFRQDLKLIKRSKKNAKIRYIGYVAENDKPALIKLAQALVYPSFYEGFGFQPLEAMAIGTPVIASQITSLPEVCGQSALLVNPYSQQDVSEAMENIFSNLELRQQLVAKGLVQAQKFSWGQAGAKVLQNLKQL